METNSVITPANRVKQVKEYYFSKKLKEVAQLNAKGMDIISLGIGGPDRPPHKDVVNRLCEMANRSDTHGYQPYVGLPSLRSAYADWYRRWYGVTLDATKEIQPLIGSKEGILHITLTFVNPGDAVLVPNPGYPTYTSVSKLAEAEIITYDLTEDNGWQPDFEELDKMNLVKVKVMWILKVKSNVDSGQFRPAMEAAVEALNCDKKWFEELNEVYSRRRKIAEKIMLALGCTFDSKQRGLFLWGRIPDAEKSSESFADRILYQARVFLTPGFIFGSNGERYIRISLCATEEKMNEALTRIINELKQ